MATPNYSYEKRQRELAKKRKAEDKRQRKLSGLPDGDDQASAETSAPATQETAAEAVNPDMPPSPGRGTA